MSRRTARSALRAELSGVGPTGPGHRPGRFPGATAKFALFGEIVIVGLIVAVVSLPVITVPLALAVGARHLRRFIRAEGSSFAKVGEDLRRGILPSLVVGVVALVIAALLVLDIVLAIDGLIPGSGVVLSAGVLGFALLMLTMVTSAGAWHPDTGWRAALASCVPNWRADPIGVTYLLAAVVFVGVVSWQLPPLAIPGLGCLVLAMVAIPERHGAPG